MRGAIAIDGRGNRPALVIAEHLLDLGSEVLLLLDTDETLPSDLVLSVRQKGGEVLEWPDNCSTEERVFLDVPWKTVIELISFAEEYTGSDSVKDNVNNVCQEKGLPKIVGLTLPPSLDSPAFRRAIGIAAKNKNNPWFKDIARGDRLAEIVAPCLDQVPNTPLTKTLSELRQWVDA